MRPVAPKPLEVIAAEWDRLAPQRRRQQASGIDLSFSDIMVPIVVRLATAAHPKSVLDVGCGTGVLTAQLRALGCDVTGVDASRESIRIAEAGRDPQEADIRFVASSVENYARDARNAFDVAVASMTLIGTPNLSDTVSAIASVVRPGGELIFTITHPWFWPNYWGYADEPWFRYSDEIFIEAQFTISREESEVVTTHVHRPLEQYVETFSAAGLSVTRLLEPMPTSSTEARYPAAWGVPRFLIGTARRV